VQQRLINDVGTAKIDMLIPIEYWAEEVPRRPAQNGPQILV
jgi:hypothetical protein